MTQQQQDRTEIANIVLLLHPSIQNLLDMAANRMKLVKESRKRGADEKFRKFHRHIAFMYLARACEMEQGIEL